MLSAVLKTLADIVGSAHCLVGADRGPFVGEGRTPCAVVSPATALEVARVVQVAAAAGIPIIPWGGGTRMGLGAPPREGSLVVVTRRLARVVEHEPGDLTATVEAGITMEALQAALGSRGQWLPLDPPEPARATLGGVLAANGSGPRRHFYGTARDLVIGIRVVGPDGVLVRAGGKVVKNVAGYDLVKLHLGALGTLGLIVQATLKLRPRPEADRAGWAVFPDLTGAAAGVAAVTASELVPHSLELLEPGAAAVCGAGGGGAAVLVGFDGLPTTVAWQLERAERLLRSAGAREIRALDELAAARALAVVRDVRRAVPAPLAIATAGVPPAQVGAYLTEATATVHGVGLGLVGTAHAGHGIVTLVLLAAGGGEPPAGPVIVETLGLLRDQARALGGHCAVEWAPLGVKGELSVWDPPSPAIGIMRAIKARLDPKGIMNPGRFVGGI